MVSWANETLESAGYSRIDAQVLVCHVLQVGPAQLIARDDLVVDNDLEESIREAVSRRLEGIPIAYIVGNREFWSIPMEVNAHVLIPRPETELLVEQVLSLVEELSDARILELGTGSGAVSIALASEIEQLEITASDRFSEALNVAKVNYRNLQSTHHSSVAEIKWLQSSWFDDVDNGDFDVICSNPPYIAIDDLHLQQGDLRFEPKSALVSGIRGLDDLTIIIAQSVNYLRSGGWLVLEHGFEQAEEVQALFKQNGFRHIQTFKDLAGLDRVTQASLS
jgi:release factor glutamine methyltransferase